MINVFFYSFILLVAILLESTITQLPIVLVMLIVFSVLERRAWILLLGVFAGLFLDSLMFRLLGTSSLFFLIVLGLLFLYGKKFETHNVFFGVVYTFFLAIVYGLIFGNKEILTSALVAAFLTGCTVFSVHFLRGMRTRHLDR